jgi:regulator of sigma E protease
MLINMQSAFIYNLNNFISSINRYPILDYIYSKISLIFIIATAIITLGIIIFIHELGHFLMAKLFNVYIPSFSIGFGPKIIKKKLGETEFIISAIPLGGYVEIATEQDNDNNSILSKDRLFKNKSYIQKMAIISNGIIFNIIFGYLALVYVTYKGSPFLAFLNLKEPAIIDYINDKDSKLEHKDIIIKIDNNNIKSIEDVNKYIQKSDNNQINITVKRNNNIIEIVENIEKRGKSLKALWYINPKPLNLAVIEAYRYTKYIISTTIYSLLNINKQSNTQLSGPLMLIKNLTSCLQMGFSTLMFSVSMISINLRIMNLIPLPIFDGGQALLETIEFITRRPLQTKHKEIIYYITLIIVITLTIYVTFKDIINIIY